MYTVVTYSADAARILCVVSNDKHVKIPDLLLTLQMPANASKCCQLIMSFSQPFYFVFSLCWVRPNELL